MVAALHSSDIPQPSTIGSPSAWKNSMMPGSMGAAPLAAKAQRSSPTRVSTDVLACSGSARTASGDGSGTAARSPA